MRALPILGLALLLSGCATLNEQECRSQTAAQLGLRDGQQGYGLWRLERHVESCARFGIALDRTAYLNARTQGLQTYCTPENAEKVGLRGERYEKVCPADQEAAFLAKYRPAYRDYLIDMRNDPVWLPRAPRI